MNIGYGNRLYFCASRHGLGWRWGRLWFLLKPDREPLLYSERYGNAIIWRGLGLRLTKRVTA